MGTNVNNKKIKFLFFSFILMNLFILLNTCVVFGATTPSVTFISQIPQDIDSVNVYNNGLNITYRIEDESEITNITLFYKTNSTPNNIMQYVNGTAVEGWFSKNDYYVNGNNYTFVLNPDDVYPGVFNIKPSEMKDLVKNSYSLTWKSNLIKIMFLNISDDDYYNDLLINVENISASPGVLQFFYCNSSYTSGRPENSVYCYNVYNLPNEDSIRVNYPESSTRYYVIPLGLNSTTHEIGDVKVTPISYIILKGPFSGDGWNVYYVNNITRHDTVQISTNSGNTWQDFSGTIDAHIHQFSGSDKFYYYVNVTNEWDNTNTSSVRSDLLDLYGLPPSAPMVYRPTEGVYYGLISINYTKAISPNRYDIVKYNISLVNLDLTYNQTITENNYQNLSYVWDSGYTLPGEYLIKVTACDSQNQCSYGVSDNITIDNWLAFLSLTENHDYNWIKWSWTAKGVKPIDYYVYVRDSEGNIIENWTNIGGNTSYLLLSAQSDTKYIITIKAQDNSNETDEISGTASTKLLNDTISTYVFINIFVMIASVVIFYIGKRRSGIGYYFVALMILLVNMYYSFSIPFEVENGYIKPTAGNVVLLGFNLILFVVFLIQTIVNIYRMLTW